MSKADVLFRGSCACARMTYHIISLPTTMTACHCITCRKLSGGAYQAFFRIPPADVLVFDNHQVPGPPRSSTMDAVSGLATLRLSTVAERISCRDCRSPLAMRCDREQGQYVWMTLGSVDEGSMVNDEVRVALRVKEHIFVSQKVGWTEMAEDGAPRFARFTSDASNE